MCGSRRAVINNARRLMKIELILNVTLVDYFRFKCHPALRNYGVDFKMWLMIRYIYGYIAVNPLLRFGNIIHSHKEIISQTFNCVPTHPLLFFNTKANLCGKLSNFHIQLNSSHGEVMIFIQFKTYSYSYLAYYNYIISITFKLCRFNYLFKLQRLVTSAIFSS